MIEGNYVQHLASHSKHDLFHCSVPASNKNDMFVLLRCDVLCKYHCLLSTAQLVFQQGSYTWSMEITNSTVNNLYSTYVHDYSYEKEMQDRHNTGSANTKHRLYAIL